MERMANGGDFFMVGAFPLDRIYRMDRISGFGNNSITPSIKHVPCQRRKQAGPRRYLDVDGKREY